MNPAVHCPFCGESSEARPGQSATCPSCLGVFVPSGSPSAPEEMPPPSGPAGGEKACPMCGETIKIAARICRFCRAQVGNAPVPGPDPRAYASHQPLPKKKSSWLMWTLIAGIILLLCCGGGIGGMFLFRTELSEESCRQNLGQLSIALRDAAETPEGVQKLDELRGTDFWHHVARDLPQQNREICGATIFRQFEPRPYRGPKKPWSAHGDADPIGACPRDAHEEGTFVLFKNGTQEFVSRTDERFEVVFQALSD